VTEAAETQIELVDPRAYGNGADDALVALASASVPGERSARATLIAAMRAHLSEGDDVAIAASFSSAPGQGVRLRLLEALKAAIDDPDSHETDGLLTRVFAIPVLFVTGGKPGAVVPSVVPGVAAVTAILRQHGALGHTENFGLSATLATAETLESLRPSLLYRWTRSIGPEGATNREVIGTDILVDSADECVHLRFLVGASVAPAQGLSFVESASRVGGWGMPVTRELASQFEQDGLSLLPLPRPPRSLVAAVPAGSFAREETRLHLFASTALRRLRASVGEPVAVLSAHSGGELRLGLSTPFDAQVREGFRWQLGSFDDLREVAASMLSLLSDCRIRDVRVVPGLQPDRDTTGTPQSLSVHDLGPSGEVRH
jgi:hypothetical protein